MRTRTATEQLPPLVLNRAGRFAHLVESVGDPDLDVAATPGWTVQDLVTHVATGSGRYTDALDGAARVAADRPALAELNVAENRRFGRLPIGDLPPAIRHGAATLVEKVAASGTDQTVPFHGRAAVTAEQLLGIYLGELLVHGRDLAGALGRRWTIEPDEAAAAIAAVSPGLTGWLSPRARHHTATYALSLRGHGRQLWVFDDGDLSVDPPGRHRVDVTISADPATLLLVAYGRTSQWPAIATGRMIAWGRRPWLAFSLTSRLQRP